MPSGKFLRFLSYSHIWIGLAAAAQAALTRSVTNLDPFHPIIAIVFFATLGTYSFQRLGRFKDAPDGDVYGWISRHRNKVAVTAALSIFLAATGAVMILPLSWIVICGILLLICTAYFFTGHDRINSLRQVPLLKIFLITVVWSIATVILPLATDSATMPAPEIVLFFVERFIFIFAVTIPFDIKDMVHDREAGVLTIPTAIGTSKSIGVFRILIIAFSILVVLHSYFGYFLTLGESAGLLVTAAIAVRMIDRPLDNKHELYFLFWIDGLLVLQYLLVRLFVFLE